MSGDGKTIYRSVTGYWYLHVDVQIEVSTHFQIHQDTVSGHLLKPLNTALSRDTFGKSINVFITTLV